MPTLKSPTSPQASAPARLAHKLLTPLDELLALGEMLQDQPLADNTRIQVQGMIRAGRRMARLLCNAIETDDLSFPPALSPNSLRELVDDVEAHWRSRLDDGASHVLLSCNAAPDLRIMVDPVRFNRMLHTLIEDALETRAWGMVELQIVVRTAPDGIVAIQGKIKAPGAATPHDHTPSLMLCRAIAQQMDGDLALMAGAREGLQLRFDLRVRRAGDVLAEEVGDAADDGSPLPPRTHLLIVDDNATNRIVAAALCEMFGCTSETAEDGMEAVEAVKSRPFDLILMDIKMPRMDGLEATKVIRALPGSGGTTPIVALTANADPDAVIAYLASGMQGVVDKPIKPDHLLIALQQALFGEDAGAAMQIAAA